jgi:hypothetical protein
MRAANDEPNPWPAFEYEVWMFFRTRALLAERAYSEHPESRVLDNALEESALIHTRILVDALLNRSSEVEDVTLDDLVPNWCSLPGVGQAIRRLRQTYGHPDAIGSPCWQLNKMLAHLTAVRGSSFDYSDLRAKIDPLITIAVRAITMHVNRPRLAQLLERIRE